MDVDRTKRELEAISAAFAAERGERLRRLHLDPADFERLADAGFLGPGLPIAEGGLWGDIKTATRPICAMVRIIAQGDPSVALVTTMHSAVLFFWLLDETAPEAHGDAWQAQRATLFESVRQGHWWGTIASEPGSGGDLLATKATARRGSDRRYALTGDKHMASGSGVTSFMVTIAVADGDALPDLYYLDMRAQPWDGSTGAELVREWDGHGMAATQSHAFRFDEFPAARYAWPGRALELAPLSGAFTACTFSAVVLGVIDAARAAARQRLHGKAARMGAFERVEWTRAINECWLIEQAYEGESEAVAELRQYELEQRAEYESWDQDEY